MFANYANDGQFINAVKGDVSIYMPVLFELIAQKTTLSGIVQIQNLSLRLRCEFAKLMVKACRWR